MDFESDVMSPMNGASCSSRGAIELDVASLLWWPWLIVDLAELMVSFSAWQEP